MAWEKRITKTILRMTYLALNSFLATNRESYMPPRWLEPLYKLATLFKVYGSLTSQKNGRGWEKKKIRTREGIMISERSKKVTHLALICLV